MCLGKISEIGGKIMKKLIIVFCISLSSLSFVLSAHADDLQFVVDEWPPFHFAQTDGTVGGFATEIMREVLKNMNRTYTIRIQPFARVQYSIKKGKADGAFVSLMSNERKEYAYFPDEPFATMKWVFFIRSKDKGRLKLNSYKDLKGHRVGVVRSFAYTDEFWKFLKENNISHDEVTYDEQNFKKLAAGRVDYVPAGLENGRYLLKKAGIEKDVAILTDFVMREDGLYAIWSKKRTDKNFVKQFSDALKDYKSSESYRKIYNRYFGEIATSEQ